LVHLVAHTMSSSQSTNWVSLSKLTLQDTTRVLL